MAERLVELATRSGQNAIAKAITDSFEFTLQNAATSQEAANSAETRAQQALNASQAAQESEANVEQIFNSILQQYGYPFTAASSSAMTDTSKIYVYTGTTSGSFVKGNWYYHNGSSWVSGGVFNSEAVDTDTTLSVEGAAADSATVGYALYKQKNRSSNISCGLTYWNASSDGFSASNPFAPVDIPTNSYTYVLGSNIQTGDQSVVLNQTSGTWVYCYVHTPTNSVAGNVRMYEIIQNGGICYFGISFDYGQNVSWRKTSPDDTLSISGTPADARETGKILESLIEDNSYDIFRYLNRQDGQSSNITFVWNDDGSCTVNGQSDGQISAFCNLFVSSSSLPKGMERGRKYKLYLYSNYDTEYRKVGIQVFKYNDGNPVIYITTYAQETILNIPEDAEGIIIRLNVPTGRTVDNETVSIKCFKVESNRVIYDSALIGFGSNPYGFGYSNDANEIYRNSIAFNSVSGGTGTLSNIPYGGSVAGWLITYSSGQLSEGNIPHQIFYPYSTSRNVMRRFKNLQSGWTEWTVLGGGGGGNTYNTTQNITQSVNTNNYNGSVSPTFTTDTNGWLQPIDTESADDGGKTDMTPAIMALLNSTGYCHLAAGIYYVSGNIDMPEGSTLEGCGEKTIIRLLSSVTDGYCVRMFRTNTVKNIQFSGGYDAFNPQTTDIGGRNGVIYIANRDGQEASRPSVSPCILTQCWFRNFNGSAIYGHNSGGSLTECMIVSSCYIGRCEVGINLDYYTEYHKFTNIVTSHCYYACINNGGNNVFTGCTFHGTIGFLIDNSSGTKRNNAHGSCIGCTFNHIDNWNHPDVLGMGEAIKIIGSSTSGFIFTGCQIWYGSITINNALGVSLSDCLIGGNTPIITVENNATAFFQNCMFRQRPNITNTAIAKFDNCYLITDGSVVSN